MRQLIAVIVAVSIAGLSACSRLMCIACDGHLGATGDVYEWLDAPSGAKSIAVVDSITPDTQHVSPLVGVEILLEPWTPRKRPASSDPRLLGHSQTVTDKTGHFRLGGTVRPGNYDATLSVRATGFQSVEQVFDHDRQSYHSVRVWLVRSK